MQLVRQADLWTALHAALPGFRRREIGPDHVWFADDIFGMTEEWIEDFANEVARRDARIPFTMQSRVNLITPPVAAALRAAGAQEVWLGVESGSQRVLDAMD